MKLIGVARLGLTLSKIALQRAGQILPCVKGCQPYSDRILQIAFAVLRVAFVVKVIEGVNSIY